MRGLLLRLLTILMIAVTCVGGGRHIAAITDAHTVPLELAHATVYVGEACGAHDCDEHGADHYGCPHAHVNCCGTLALAAIETPFTFEAQGRTSPFDLGSAVPLRQPSYLPQRPPSFAA